MSSPAGGATGVPAPRSGSEAGAPEAELPPPSNLTLDEVLKIEEVETLFVQSLINANIGISNMAYGMVKRALDDLQD